MFLTGFMFGVLWTMILLYGFALQDYVELMNLVYERVMEGIKKELTK